MDSLYLLIPLAILLVGLAVGLLFWAVKSGQYDDLEKRLAEGPAVLRPLGGLGHRHAPGLEPDQDHAVEAVVALDDLVGHPPDGSTDVVGVHDL